MLTVSYCCGKLLVRLQIQPAANTTCQCNHLRALREHGIVVDAASLLLPLRAAFLCHQHDNLVPTMTATESVGFYASIVLPPDMPKDVRKARIARVLRMMGLSHAQNTLVSRAVEQLLEQVVFVLCVAAGCTGKV